jgi:hypothetical protein
VGELDLIRFHPAPVNLMRTSFTKSKIRSNKTFLPVRVIPPQNRMPYSIKEITIHHDYVAVGVFGETSAETIRT